MLASIVSQPARKPHWFLKSGYFTSSSVEDWFKDLHTSTIHIVRKQANPQNYITIKLIRLQSYFKVDIYHGIGLLERAQNLLTERNKQRLEFIEKC